MKLSLPCVRLSFFVVELRRRRRLLANEHANCALQREFLDVLVYDLKDAW